MTRAIVMVTDIYVICWLGGLLKMLPGPQAEGSIFKIKVTVVYYPD